MCLFVVEVIFYFIIKLSKDKRKTILLSLLSIFIIGFAYSRYINIKLPWTIDVSLTATVFFGIGYIIKGKLDLNNISSKTLPIFLALSIATGMLNDKVEVYDNYYGNYFLFFISAISGIIIAVILAKLIKSSKILNFIGMNTLVLLGLHLKIIYIPLEFLSNKILILLSLDRTDFLISLIMGLLFVCITIIILIPFVNFINKHIPFIVGKSKPKVVNKKVA